MKEERVIIQDQSPHICSLPSSYVKFVLWKQCVKLKYHILIIALIKIPYIWKKNVLSLKNCKCETGTEGTSAFFYLKLTLRLPP